MRLLGDRDNTLPPKRNCWRWGMYALHYSLHCHISLHLLIIMGKREQTGRQYFKQLSCHHVKSREMGFILQNFKKVLKLRAVAEETRQLWEVVSLPTQKHPSPDSMITRRAFCRIPSVWGRWADAPLGLCLTSGFKKQNRTVRLELHPQKYGGWTAMTVLIHLDLKTPAWVLVCIQGTSSWRGH